jgi:hypothetical protein
VLWKAGAATLAEMTRAELVALAAVVQRVGAHGSETDLLIAGADGAKTPVSVLWSLDGTITLDSGAPVKALLTPGATGAELAAKYQLNPFSSEAAPWSPAELATIEKALSLLTPDEVKLLGGLGFRRKATDPSGRFAYYRRADDGMTIDVFDKAFSLDNDYFIGTPDAPMAMSVSTIIHEMAHAMSDFHGRQKAIKANAAVAEAKAAQEKAKADGTPESKKEAAEKSKLASELRKANNTLDGVMRSKGRAAERAFAAVVDPKTSVTAYGKTSLDEHLAESFVLSKLDVAALTRVAAPAVEWFSKGSLAAEASKTID